MYVMRDDQKRLLDEYMELGTPQEIRRRLSSPYPAADEGYAPLPQITDDQRATIRDIMTRMPSKPGSGLLEDDGCGAPITLEFEHSTVVKQEREGL